MADIRQGIIETANALGMDPGVLATIISYETAGTFDPTKRGRRPSGGTSRPDPVRGAQAKRYGVDWNDPLGSQLRTRRGHRQIFPCQRLEARHVRAGRLFGGQRRRTWPIQRVPTPPQEVRRAPCRTR